VRAPHHCATPNQEEYSSAAEPQRLALHRAAQAALGEEEGDTLMALTPPANTDIATRQDIEHWQAAFRADIARSTAELRASTTKVVVGTGVALYLAMVGTAFAGIGLLLRILEIV
jgi:hypothetical protein